MEKIIVILEDDERRTAAMRNILNESFPSFSPVFFDNAPDMIEWLKRHLEECTVIALDHDLGPNRERKGEVFDPGTGRDVVDYLTTQPPHCNVLIHTSNSPAAIGMEMALSDSGWTSERVISFSDLGWIDVSWAQAIGRLLNPEVPKA